MPLVEDGKTDVSLLDEKTEHVQSGPWGGAIAPGVLSGDLPSDISWSPALDS